MTDKEETKTHLSAIPAKRVMVIGAGVAGMTAAHELAERGYEVEVIESTPDPYNDRSPLVGGMARTSWATFPEPVSQAPFRANTRLSGGAARMVALKKDGGPISTWVKLDSVDDVSDAVGYLEQLKRDGQSVVVAIFTMKTNRDAETVLRLPVFTEAVNVGYARIEPFIDPTAVTVLVVGKPEDVGIQITPASDRVPGEHGFRFFPSFYRHLFDTMKRIPILEAAVGKPMLSSTGVSADSSRSAFDNLMSADAIQLGLAQLNAGGVRTFDIARQPMRSLEVIRRFLANVLERAGYRAQDIHRLATRYLEYMSSSPRRRWQEYENVSWSSFLGLSDGGYSEYFQGQVNSGSQALVAMSSEKNDARTIGSVAIALSLDQVRAGDYVDGTLRGPTSVALFDPWRAYLESIGVKFTLGQLVGFTGKGMAVRPSFAVTTTDKNGKSTLQQLPIDPADYYVNSLPVTVMRSLFTKEGNPPEVVLPKGDNLTLLSKQNLLEANRLCLELDLLEAGASAAPGDVSENDDLGRYLDADWLGDPSTNPDDGPLRYMTGIQFYFDSDVKLLKGHSLCLDSAWGVSYLSQVQYWQDRPRGLNGQRGVISAIFTKWTVPTQGTDGARKSALECNPEELAERVWLQIRAAWNAKIHGPLPTPAYFYLDENMTRSDAGASAWTNLTPYLVNDVGTWAKRPGKRTGEADYAYQLQLGHTVFAGAFMRSVTRLNTMEAANETARRAVNAILSRDAAATQTSVAQACELWNLEDYELGELLQVRDFDRRVAARGGANIFRSRIVEAILRGTPWDLVRLGFPTYKDLDSDL